MKIAIIGTGYVGLVVGTGFAESGHTVACMDRDEKRIEALRNGEVPIYEPGLEELVMHNLEDERITFTTSVEEAVKEKLLVFICVDTPSAEDGESDTSHVFEAAEAVARAIESYTVVVLKSTCPVGTAEKIREAMAAITKQPFDVVANPEFLKEGAAVDDFMRPDRVVVGCDDVRVLEIMRELYSPFLRTGKPFLAMSVRSAEMSKYAVNAMIAARISLMNELANVAAAYGADIGEVRESLMADSRIGSAYLFPGIGFGGSCLPKDAVAVTKLAAAENLPNTMLDGISKTNEAQRTRFLDMIRQHYGNGLEGKRLALWGATFKPRTDDLRAAPALTVLDGLLDAGASVTVHDAIAGGKLKELYGDRIELGRKMYDCLDGADGLAIITEWREFHHPDFERMANAMRERVIFDGRNLYSPKTMSEHGFRYYSVGRPAV
jgi:UDPglucose 6-dehydrogenase